MVRASDPLPRRGALKATNGSFNYKVPAGMTVADYKSVVVWCRAFGVLITWADLT